MSFGNEWTEICLDQSQTTLVIGKNGSGKSSGILDSVSFALFNKPFRNITKPQLTNSITGKQCVVELDFLANGYPCKVIRGQKPNIFEIYKDGELINQTADNRDYQDAFEKHILKVNHKTFCQIVMLGSAIFTPFMALPTPQRRAVIEDLLDLEIFSTMNSLLSSRIKIGEKQIIEITNQKNILLERYTLTKKHIKKTQQNRVELIKERQQQIDENEKNLLSAQHDRVKNSEEVQHLLEHIQHGILVNTRKEKITTLQNQLQYKHTTLANEIKFLASNKECPTCKQKIDESYKIHHITDKNSQITETIRALEQLKEKHKEAENQIGDITEVWEKIQELNMEIYGFDQCINGCLKDIKRLKDEISKLEKDNESVDISKLDEMKSKLGELDKKINELKTQDQVMGYATVMLKDSGIKSKIIKTFVPVINQLINKYLAALDFFVEFSINEQFEEKLLSRFRDTFSYESFSEGEKMRLNIAILFAWRALAKLRGSIDCNLVILDELLDSSLDNEGLEDTIKLLTNLNQNVNIFVISHKKDMKEKFGRIVAFEKVRNFSRIDHDNL